MKTIDPKNTSTSLFHSYMLAAVAPRPIALASTIDKDGQVNLSPFSFFNAFSSNPPILIFSPARRVRDNSTKHTLENVKEHPEVVINVVTYDLVQQTSLSSTEYARGVNEFIKAGLSEAASSLVKPPRVAESPVAFECKVREVIALGSEGGAGNLIVCEVLMIHVSETVLDENGKIDPLKLNLVGRMGADFYTKAFGEALFEVEKPLTKLGIGIDALPTHIKHSRTLTGNELAQLANVEAMPTASQLEKVDLPTTNLRGEALASFYLSQNNVLAAWKVLINNL
ncbi:MAG: flavin reductase family protein [Cytophagales bacterium]|nr:MAG: flavin reductase family protein [Cytophagales bacterium]TAF61384.1 MAG: flavin reductase family protein [Cytophagales bacterium]